MTVSSTFMLSRARTQKNGETALSDFASYNHGTHARNSKGR